MRTRVIALAAATALAGSLAVSPAFARDQIKIVGSSTVFPYTQAVAEEFAKKSGNKAPVLESTGTGGGMKIFCQGVGEAEADVTGASRQMKPSEWEDCQKNGVTDVTEVLLGYDGISIAISNAGPDFDLSLTQIYLALAKEVPVDGKLVDNPYKKWSEIDASLPDIDILAYGPPPTSGTRDAFVELAMHEGCMKLDYFQANKDQVKDKCTPMRQDGPFVEAGENDNLIVQRLEADANAVGIFGYSFLYENNDKLKAAKISGIEPSFDTIADFSFPISRPIFIYIKNAHMDVIPGLKEFVAEYTSDEALAPGGYLTERGLTPMLDEKRKEVQESVSSGKKFEGPSS
ncbi:MAG: substrate-binding domain-containing protein [Rhodomicrobiaceae bacterium]